MDVKYFESGGKQNTDETLKIARDYADKNGVKSIVVASTTGFTAEKASDAFKGKNLVIVTHAAGFAEKDKQQFPEDLRKRLESKGVKVLTTTHALGGTNKLYDNSAGNTIADSLRILCQGVKVCVEITATATDAGLVKISEDVVAIAGTGKGADTALVIVPANSSSIFDMRIKSVLAKPL